MQKVLIVLVSIFVVLGFLYWWFVPWRLALRQHKISGLKEANPDCSALLGKNKRVLAITGHVDDLEFFCGGTMARLQEQKATVWLTVGTENYTWYYSSRATTKKKTEARKKEQEKVAKYFGYKKVIYLGYRDFRLEPTEEAINKVEKIIKEFKPDAIMMFDPVDGSSVQHRDHNAAGIIALEAAKKSGTDAEIFMFATSKPSYYVDVTDTIDRKWVSLEMFSSVFGERNGMRGRLESWAKQAGKEAGAKYAEPYHVVKFK